MSLFIPSTAGEHLYQFIYRKFDNEHTWKYLKSTIRPIGDHDKLSAYYRQHATLFLCCKLISAGKSCVFSEEENTASLFTIIERYPWNHLNEDNRLLRLLSTAVLKSDRAISHGVKETLRTFAKHHHNHCYLCGKYLDFDDDGNELFYTAEHLWPSSLGGDSSEDNLLPACAKCNNAKGNIATWVSTDIHSLFLGINPTSEQLEKISFKRRYALFHRAAMLLATQRQCTLKRAFIALGPWTDIRVHDFELASDMFNLKTHQEIEELENYEEL